MDFNEMWDKIIAEDIATEEECRLVTNINGNTTEALLDILYCRTGFRNFEQWDDDPMKEVYR